MSFQSKFLSLSMKEQICLVLISLTLFCILVILSICGSLAYEILKEDFRLKKLYFYEQYKEYIESCLLFQNFYLLQYEEIIKRIQKQIWEIQQTFSIYDFESNFQNFEKEDILSKIEHDSYYSINNNININNNFLYYTYFSDSISHCLSIENELYKQYNTLSSLLFSHNIYDSFRFPMYEVPIMTSPIFFNINCYTMFSFNFWKMKDKIMEICGNEINLSKIFNYYNEKINDAKININEKLLLFFTEKPSLVEHMFDKILGEINKEVPYKNLDSYLEYAMPLSGYFTKIDYSNNLFYFINDIEELYYYYYIESNLIEKYIYFINNKISSFIDMYFIPLFSENNTIISPELCVLFQLKQLNFFLEEKEIEELFNNINKGESIINKCFSNNNILDNQEELKTIFNLNFTSFLYVRNYTIKHGIIYLENSTYYFVKYTYPNYNSLKEFNSDYFLLEKINYYLFASFREPINFANHYCNISLNCFYLIIIIIVYIWVLCLIINLIVFNKIIGQLTEPINKLQEAVESNSITDENIFKYEYDDIINELFLTCKELLSGEIHKNDIGCNNFSIISIPKDKENIKNIHLKNLRINNDILNQLISEKQNIFDCSKNIKKNYLYKDIKMNKYINDKQSRAHNTNVFFDDNNNKDEINKKSVNKITDKIKYIKNNEEKEKEDREPYIKLFKINEYYYNYLGKNKKNYIYIINNEINDETKSLTTKINKDNMLKNSIKLDSKINKTIKRGESKNINNVNENISINLMDNNDITYLWYMKEKKSRNISLNYNISENYIELFTEYIN